MMLEAELTRIRDWQKKEATRDRVKQTIYDFLYSDGTGLPDAYSEDEIGIKSDLVFGHVFYQHQREAELVH